MIPTYLSTAWAAIGPAVANHLWQSTLFAAIAAILALSLRRNQARVRYALWLAASVKFLIPFSVLISVGSHLGWSTAPPPSASQLSFVMQQVGQPFATAERAVASLATTAPRNGPTVFAALLLATWLAGAAAILLSRYMRWRRLKAVVRAATPLREGPEMEALRSLERRVGIHHRIQLASTVTSVEPGIFGIFRPTLLLPAGIADRLVVEQLEAIVAHELCHVRRRDNLAAAIHMAVEAIFWFHPLVWWLGARLVEERERACDEEVLQFGSQPEVYAEGILKICQFYLESPLACMSGITGSDLKARIVRIMTQGVATKLSFSRKLLLTTAGVTAIAGPILFGILNAPQSRAQTTVAASAPTSKFEVASIKPGDPSARGIFQRMEPGGRYTAQNVTVRILIEQAYDIHDFQLSGGPDWMNSARYDIVAKAEDPSDDNPRTLNEAQREAFREKLQQRLQSLLDDRFQLKFHKSAKEQPIYALVVGKSGSKLQEAKDTAAGPMGTLKMRPGNFTGHAMSMPLLAANLSNLVGRVVADKTDLKGLYDVTLEFTPERGQMMGFPGPGPEGRDMPPPPDPNGPSIFTALQEQLGLKLESQKGPVEMLVIDQLEKPSEN